MMLLSSALEEDVADRLADGEPQLRIVGMVTRNGHTWALVQASEYEYRAYTDQSTLLDTGEICWISSSLRDLIDHV